MLGAHFAIRTFYVKVGCGYILVLHNIVIGVMAGGWGQKSKVVVDPILSYVGFMQLLDLLCPVTLGKW